MIISTSNTQINQKFPVLENAFRLKIPGVMTKFFDINILQDPNGIQINQQDKI